MKSIILIAVISLSACTIAPTPVSHKEASAWTKDHIKSYDSTGLVVDSEYLRAYKDSLNTYGNKLPIRERTDNYTDGVVQRPDGLYHVTFAVNKRYSELHYIEQNEGP
jgi:hypothetical protein